MHKALNNLKRFISDEKGSAYSLSYMMVLPFIMMLIIMIAETAMILVAKMGTTYAAYAAVRSAVVWQPTAGDKVAREKATQAARQAMTPFANGMIDARPPGSDNATTLEDEMMKLYQQSSTSQASLNYIRRKYRYAADAVKVTISKQPPKNDKEPWNYDVKASVDYQYTFHIPILARMYGSSNGKMTIQNETVLSSEAPMNEKQSLGITYASPK